jgi:hypothetical protein
MDDINVPQIAAPARSGTGQSCCPLPFQGTGFHVERWIVKGQIRTLQAIRSTMQRRHLRGRKSGKARLVAVAIRTYSISYGSQRNESAEWRSDCRSAVADVYLSVSTETNKNSLSMFEIVWHLRYEARE